MLPRLKHLTLKGIIYLDWPAPSDADEASQVAGLKPLSLSSHSLQVRPARRDFRRLLNASPGLKSGSGPIPEESSSSAGNASGKDKVLTKTRGWLPIVEAS